MSAKVKRYDDTRAWYAVHTYSGYEEQVSDSIKQRIDGVDMADKIFDVLVPKEKMIVIKNGKRKVIEQKIFQGYILVEMKLTEDAWFIIRNTPGVTGFVGAGTTPTPVSAKEIAKIKKRMGVNEPKHDIDLQPGEVISITDGPFKGFDGTVSEIDPIKGKIKVMVSMFGRDTNVELDALQVKKV
ncbi:transcription termination/antitermination protein NusG [Candidatus Saccharibacteria bacterium]|nr:transcription termination/antitermination protein NusG [Candidatus Saccharibacteria bacterium]MCL1962838.1 transcription termination/antitermination protein NusG [Candidatus Saccharibacteria bacterium]